MNDEQLFELAVKTIRLGGSHYVELINELETAAGTPTDVRTIISRATKHVEETQKAAWDCSVQAFKNGESFFSVCKKLEAFGWHPYDAQCTASRAKAQAEKEIANESLADGLAALGQSE